MWQITPPSVRYLAIHYAFVVLVRQYYIAFEVSVVRSPTSKYSMLHKGVMSQYRISTSLDSIDSYFDFIVAYPVGF